MQFLFLVFEASRDSPSATTVAKSSWYFFSLSGFGNCLSVQPFRMQTLLKVKTKIYWARQLPFCFTGQAWQMGPGYDVQGCTGEWSHNHFQTCGQLILLIILTGRSCWNYYTKTICNSNWSLSRIKRYRKKATNFFWTRWWCVKILHKDTQCKFEESP